MARIKTNVLPAGGFQTIDDSQSAMRSGRNRTLNQVPEVFGPVRGQSPLTDQTLIKVYYR